MTDRRPSSTKVRRECFEINKYQCPLSKRWLMTCHLCGGVIDVIKDGPDSWEAEHTVPFATGGTEVLPAHVDCHKVKTARDVKEIAKGKRSSAKHFGIERKRSKLRKPAGMKFDWSAGRYVKVSADD